MKNTEERLPTRAPLEASPRQVADPGYAGSSAAASCRLPIERQDSTAFSITKLTAASRAGFTLIELLAVIAIIGVIAGFTLVVVTGIKKTEYVSTATAELMQLETALDNYQHKYGVYPPTVAGLPLTNTLYYELCGVYATNKPTQGFQTLDNQCFISTANYQTAFQEGGIINCTKGSGDEGTAAQNFLIGLKQNRLGISTNNGVILTNLITSVRGPDLNYRPLGGQDINPFRYMYPGTNNPNSYDLWVELVIRGKTNLICNWSKQVIVNSAYP